MTTIRDVIGSVEHAEDRTWKLDGLCTQYDPDTWFPEDWSPNRAEAADHVDTIRQICLACPVLDRCLSDAMADEIGATMDHVHGMFGAMTPRERLYWRRHPELPAEAVRGMRPDLSLEHLVQLAHLGPAEFAQELLMSKPAADRHYRRAKAALRRREQRHADLAA